MLVLEVLCLINESINYYEHTGLEGLENLCGKKQIHPQTHRGGARGSWFAT